MLKNKILQRLLPVIPIVFFAMTIMFIISRMIPGDPARLIAGEFATEEQVQKIREEYNLDKSIPVQLMLYFSDVLHGDFGRSMHTRRAVMKDIKELGFSDLFPIQAQAIIPLLEGRDVIGQAQTGSIEFAYVLFSPVTKFLRRVFKSL